MHKVHIVAQPTISGPPSEHIAMPPKRKDEELDLDVHPKITKACDAPEDHQGV